MLSDNQKRVDAAVLYKLCFVVDKARNAKALTEQFMLDLRHPIKSSPKRIVPILTG